MNIVKAAAAALLIGVTAPALGACDRGGASVPARDHSAAAEDDRGGSRAYARNDRSGDRGGRDGGYRRREPVPSFHGEPMWTDNSRHSARENAEYHFQKSGGDIGAKSLDDFLVRVHKFVDHPPSGALRITRANGDRLIYDPKANVFAVARRDGAPRTIFKPENGMAYWKEQQAGGGSGSRSYAGRRSSDSGYGGGYGRRNYGGGDRGGAD
jgi:pyocin large subunit-like protein